MYGGKSCSQSPMNYALCQHLTVHVSKCKWTGNKNIK